jgi:AraC-like DNA-binding protein
MEEYRKQGYLENDFRIFHLCDAKHLEVAYHYHDFAKIMLFIKGNVNYIIEGRSYELKPYDIVLVNAGQLHRPQLMDDAPYERIIIYISSSFMKKYQTDDCDLSRCFKEAGKGHQNVLRIENLEKSSLYAACRNLERSFEDQEFAKELYQRILFLEFMILLNRAILNNHVNSIQNEISNRKIADVIDYISAHLAEELTVDKIAGNFYLSRSYLMHLFKAETGYSLGSYINEKRLLLSKSLIQNGKSVTEACYECGFRDYSTFSRAFKRKFHTTPKNAGDLL